MTGMDGSVTKAGWSALAAAMLASAAASPATPPDTARYYQVGPARLWVETFGHGPPILFLHGGMMDFDNAFPSQRAYFDTDYTLIGIDQRGQGHSPDGPWTLSYKLMADDTAAILQQLRVGPVDVVGHSDGGKVALLLARDHPELVHRLVVSGVSFGSGLTAEQAQQRREWSPDRLAAKLQQLTELLPRFIRADYGRVSPDGPGHWMAMLGKVYLMWIEPLTITPAELKAISAPVMLVSGDRELTPVEETTVMYRALPHGQLFIVPGTGHLTLLDRPALLNPAIREFLDQPDGATPARTIPSPW
jgi:pimeloyl-ACP methyl ester carboxylesterase